MLTGQASKEAHNCLLHLHRAVVSPQSIYRTLEYLGFDAGDCKGTQLLCHDIPTCIAKATDAVQHKAITVASQLDGMMYICTCNNASAAA